MVFAVIGRVPWEIGWYAGKRQWSRIGCAPRAGTVGMNQRTVWTRYYTPRVLQGVSGFVYAATSWLVRICAASIPAADPRAIPRLHQWLWWLDQHTAGWPLLRSLGDHFLIILRRRSTVNDPVPIHLPAAPPYAAA
jgi:hypothetical protein